MTPLILIIRIIVLKFKASVKFRLISEYMLLINSRDLNLMVAYIQFEIMLIKDSKS